MKSKARSSATSRWGMTFADEVEAVLRRLPAREEHILRLRFGIPNTKQDIDDIAASLLLTRKAVRRIEGCALRKLWLAAAMEARSECANAGRLRPRTKMASRH